MTARSYRLLRAILNTAVTEDELIIVNPCRIKGAGEEGPVEGPSEPRLIAVEPNRSPKRDL